ncbi:MAG: NAD(P)(+) transhydrogenase (Re/Si-specific) subunit beta [Verrucomicrobia bacterium]|nr:NAD(P)(+) transhydrogenase (Re/Si-specific) subunit beta [Verrucomicrobiota bacterium]
MNYSIQFAYLIATALFVFALKWMNKPETARRGVLAGVTAMLLAVIGTLETPGIVNFGHMAIAVVIGTAIGIPLSRVPLTAVPQRTALSHAFGGLAAGLVGTAKYYLWLGEGGGELTPLRIIAISAEVLLGFLTFTGSLMAAGKLQEILPTRPVTYRNQNVLNLSLLGVAVACAVVLVLNPAWQWLFPIIIALALTFGVLLILPIGGADMPTVISLLNSYAGLSAVAMGFVLDNKLLITAGALDGSSGFILSVIMCRAMNRSFTNVLFGAFGTVAAKSAQKVEGELKPITAEESFAILEGARSVVFVPGYGLAVAQAQHAVRELAELLEKNGAEIRYAIHPVAGRMPGHMNVLLAEANVPYDQLYDMEAVNRIIDTVDVCVVIGANDVVNPAAREQKDSPIYGMPIVEVDRARTVIVLKRSMAPGFAGIENLLFYKENTRMLFGDAKATLQALVAEFKAT